MGRGDLSDAQWDLVKGLMPKQGRGGKWNDHRVTVNGMLWVLRTGAPWRDLPEKYGKWMTVYQRFRRWSEAGIWEAAATVLAQAMADNRHHSIDSTTVRGHVSAAGAKGGLANRLLAARGAGSPVRFIVSVMPSVSRLPSTSPAARRPTARSSKRSVRSPKHGPAT